MDAAIYQRMAELDERHWWFVARRGILEEVIRRYAQPVAGARVLEIGCGTGHNLPMLQQFGSVEATELDRTARAIASRRLGRKVENAALPDLSAYPEASFDLVALLDVLEHVPDDHAALTAISSRLKRGGKLIITVPGNPWMWSEHDVAHHHHRRYTRANLATAAQRAGFKINFLTPFNTLLFPAVAAARFFGRLLGRKVADDAMPPKLINKLLLGVFGLERHLIGRVPFPAGVSLVAVLERP